MTTASEESALLRELRRIVINSNPSALPLVELAATASSAVVEEHPLGMFAVHFKLPTCAVRLHVWTPATAPFRDQLSQLHDHIWHLESYVLRGAILHEVYDLADDESGDDVWVHDYLHHTLQSLGRKVRLVTKHHEYIQSGQHYSLHAGVVHRTSPAANSAVTLVYSTPSARTQARIIGSRGQESVQSVTRRAASFDRVIQELQVC